MTSKVWHDVKCMESILIASQKVVHDVIIWKVRHDFNNNGKYVMVSKSRSGRQKAWKVRHDIVYGTLNSLGQLYIMFMVH